MSEGKYSIFSYMYRDYANFKSYKDCLFEGQLSVEEIQTLHQQMFNGEQFIAEQVGIPSAHQELWALSDGKIADDTEWHTFLEIRYATEAEQAELPVWGCAQELLSVFLVAGKAWNPCLSALSQQI